MRKILAAIIGLGLVLTSAACSAPEEEITTNDEADSMSTIETINGATVIRAKKKAISWGDSWTIFADDEEVGTIKGVPLYMIGDTYSLFSNDGNLVGSESENFKVLNSTANIYDYDNVKTGRIEQKIVSLLIKFNLFEDDVQIGSAEQSLALKMKADIKDSSGAVAWKSNRKALSFGADISVTKESDGEISGMNALWMSLMMNEIYEAQKSD